MVIVAFYGFIQMESDRGQKRIFPSTFQDFDIVTNIPFAKVSTPHRHTDRARVIPSFLQKDFDVITNRYLFEPPEKIQHDNLRAKQEAIYKHRKLNRFNPLLQKYLDAEEDERMRQWEEAAKVEEVVRKDAVLPPHVKNSDTCHYDIVRHVVDNPEDLKALEERDKLLRAKYSRVFNRQSVETAWNAQAELDYRKDLSSRLRRISFSRFDEEISRGYDILSNMDYFKRSFNLPHIRAPQPRCPPHKTLWERTGLQQSVAQPDLEIPTARVSEVPTARLSQRSSMTARSKRSNLSARISGRAKIPPLQLRPQTSN